MKEKKETFRRMSTIERGLSEPWGYESRRGCYEWSVKERILYSDLYKYLQHNASIYRFILRD